MDAPGDGANSDHSLFDATGADASSAAGRGRGNGDERRSARCLLALLPATWFSHVVKSCAIAETIRDLRKESGYKDDPALMMIVKDHSQTVLSLPFFPGC